MTRRTKNTTLWMGLALLLSVLALLVGCSRNPSAPDLESEPEQYTLDHPPPALRAPNLSPARQALTLPSLDEWIDVALEPVDAGVTQLVTGSRYMLFFREGSLTEKTTISVQERSPDLLYVQLGPHGIQFGESIDLCIDYSGTNADPKSANYDGSVPVLWWFNEQTSIWEEVPGEIDRDRLEFTAKLGHFSEYILGGKAGW